MAEEIHKSSVFSTQVGDYYRYVNNNDNGAITDNTFVANFTQYFNGVKNPQWKDQIRLGQNASTNMDGIRVESSIEDLPIIDVSWTYTPTWYSPYNVKRATAYGTPVPNLLSDDLVKGISSTTAYNEAASLFHLKANSALRSLQSGVTAGEWPETLRLIKRRGRSIFDGSMDYASDVSKQIRKNKSGGTREQRARNLVSSVSDLWLEYAFGWAPLVNDIDDAIDYFNNESRALRKKVRAIYSDSWPSGPRFLAYIGGSHAAIKYYWQGYKTHSVQLVGSVSLGGQNSLKFKKLGLHPSDWLPTIYELVPYSFLVDYFTNLNGIVAAFGNLSLNLDWCTMTERRKYETRYTNSSPSYTSTSPAYSGAKLLKYVPLRGSHSKTHVGRDAHHELSVPGLVFSLPDSVRQWLNIGALIGARAETRRLVSNL